MPNNNSSAGKPPNFPLTYFSQLPTAVDRDTFEQIKTSSPSAETHPNVFAWFYLVKRFSDAVRATWGGAAAGGKQDKKPAQAKKEDKPKGGDDDMDLFGDDDEEDEVSSLFNRCKRYTFMRSIGS